MTLAQCRTEFREQLADLKGQSVEDLSPRWPDNVVDDRLNTGWQHVSDEIRGFKQVVVDGITSGSQFYGLPDNVISVFKVEMLRNGKLYCVPSQKDIGTIQTGDTTTCSPGYPLAYSVSTHLYDDNTTALELYFWPAPNWTEADALYVYAIARFKAVTSADGSVEVGLHPELRTAGMWWALHKASGLDPRCKAEYREALSTWYKSGVDNSVYPKYDGQSTGRRWSVNPNMAILSNP